MTIIQNQNSLSRIRTNRTSNNFYPTKSLIFRRFCLEKLVLHVLHRLRNNNVKMHKNRFGSELPRLNKYSDRSIEIKKCRLTNQPTDRQTSSASYKKMHIRPHPFGLPLRGCSAAEGFYLLHFPLDGYILLCISLFISMFKYWRKRQVFNNKTKVPRISVVRYKRCIYFVA